MEVKELILAKCINNEDTSLEEGKYYQVEKMEIGQSCSYINVNGNTYNSIRFEFYDDKLEEFDIYHSKYSPYHKKEDEEKEEIEELEYCEIDDDTLDGLVKSINELNKEFVTAINGLSKVVKGLKGKSE